MKSILSGPFSKRQLLAWAGFVLCLSTVPSWADENPEPVKSQLEIFTGEAPKITSAVCAPLSVPLADYKAPITYMRDNLLDEAKEKPSASEQTYQMAAKLCSAWLSALEEREQRVSSIGITGGTHTDMHSAKKTVLHDWRDELNYFRELDDERRQKEREAQESDFFDDAITANGRTAVRRYGKYLDARFIRSSANCAANPWCTPSRRSNSSFDDETAVLQHCNRGLSGVQSPGRHPEVQIKSPARRAGESPHGLCLELQQHFRDWWHEGHALLERRRRDARQPARGHRWASGTSTLKRRVKILITSRNSVITLQSFNESTGTYSGSDGSHSITGKRLDPLLPRGAVKKMQPVATEIPSRTGQAKIDVLAEQASAVTSGVIVQLDATALDHRAAIS